MIARNIAIGFGIAIVLPLLIFYGVSIFSPEPNRSDFYNPAYFAEGTTKAQQEAGFHQQEKNYDQARAKFTRRLLFVSAPLGYLAILIGGFMAVSAVSTGLIFGGIFSVIDGYWNDWDFQPATEKFFALLLALIVLLFIAYKKKPKKNDIGASQGA